MINYFSDVNSRAWQCLTTPTRVKRGLRSPPATGTTGKCDAIGYVHVLRCEGFQIILDDDRMRIRGSPGVLQVRTGMCLGLNVSWIKHCGRRMIRNICYRASNPSMHCAWLEASFELCNTVIPLVTCRNASFLCHHKHPAPPLDHSTTSTSGKHPRPSFLPMFSRLAPPPRESPLPRSPNVGRSARAPLTRVTRLRHPRPLTHASRRSFPLHRRHAHLRVTDRPRLHHFHPPRVADHVPLPSFLPQMSPSPANATLTRTLCSTIPS